MYILYFLKDCCKFKSKQNIKIYYSIFSDYIVWKLFEKSFMQLERYHREWAEYFLREIAQFESAEKSNSANIINYFCTSSVTCIAVWSHPHFEYKYLVYWLYGNSPIHKSALNVCTIQPHWWSAKRFIARANFSMVSVDGYNSNSDCQACKLACRRNNSIQKTIVWEFTFA